MQKTPNLGMNLFESGDPVLAENFNQNTTILETELSRKCGISHGSWDGDDTDNKALTFDRKPVLVIVSSSDGLFFCFQGSTICLYHDYTLYAKTGRPISWSEDGYTLFLQESNHFNRTNYSYKYIAFLEN